MLSRLRCITIIILDLCYNLAWVELYFVDLLLTLLIAIVNFILNMVLYSYAICVLNYWRQFTAPVFLVEYVLTDRLYLNWLINVV